MLSFTKKRRLIHLLDALFFNLSFPAGVTAGLIIAIYLTANVLNTLDRSGLGACIAK